MAPPRISVGFRRWAQNTSTGPRHASSTNGRFRRRRRDRGGGSVCYHFPRYSLTSVQRGKRSRRSSWPSSPTTMLFDKVNRMETPRPKRQVNMPSHVSIGNIVKTPARKSRTQSRIWDGSTVHCILRFLHVQDIQIDSEPAV